MLQQQQPPCCLATFQAHSCLRALYLLILAPRALFTCRGLHCFPPVCAQMLLLRDAFSNLYLKLQTVLSQTLTTLPFFFLLQNFSLSKTPHNLVVHMCLLLVYYMTFVASRHFFFNGPLLQKIYIF